MVLCESILPFHDYSCKVIDNTYLGQHQVPMMTTRACHSEICSSVGGCIFSVCCVVSSFVSSPSMDAPSASVAAAVSATEHVIAVLRGFDADLRALLLPVVPYKYRYPLS